MKNNHTSSKMYVDLAWFYLVFTSYFQVEFGIDMQSRVAIVGPNGVSKNWDTFYRSNLGKGGC